MSQGLTTTFRILTETPNEAAVRALIAALDSRLPPVRRQALESLIARQTGGGKREVLARLDQLNEEGLEFFCRNAARMTSTLRSAILDAGDPLRSDACRAALLLGEVDLIPSLASALENPDDPAAAELGETLLGLAERLADQLGGPQAEPGRRDPRAVRDHVLGSLERAIAGFGRRGRSELVEAFAMLAPTTSATLHHLLSLTGNPAAPVLLDQLVHSTRPAIMRLVLDLLEEARTPLAVITATGRRGDAAFVRRLLERSVDRPSPSLLKNLKRIRSLAWVQDGFRLLDELDGREQQAAAALAILTGIARDQAFQLIRHLVQKGKPAGRRAAAKALEEFAGAEANDLALRALDDPDPTVQAIALRQLRRRSIPGALPRLLQMVESPHPEVRTAAQESLAEFSFQRYLGTFDMLEEEVRRKMGEMVNKVDPLAVPLLRGQLSDSVRSKRLRAIEMAIAMRLVDRVEDLLGGMLADEDYMLRLQAASALGETISPGSEALLHKALEDPCEPVRAAARRSLGRRGIGRGSESREDAKP